MATPTATSVAPGTATVSYGQSATFTATVSSSAGVPPDGSVQFLVNGVAYGSPVALSGATAQLAISEPVGSFTIAAQYTGDANYAVTLPGAETTASLTVNQAATDTAVTPSTATVSYGQSATFTATVSSSAGVPPGGSVQFLVNGAAYGSPVALSGATAQLAISEPVGSFTIAAQYTGDANYAVTLPGAETTASLTVNQAATATSVTPSTLITLAPFDGTDGALASGGLISDAAGNLFGTTSQGGPGNNGTVFEVAAGSGAITTLATFNGTNGQAYAAAWSRTAAAISSAPPSGAAASPTARCSRWPRAAACHHHPRYLQRHQRGQPERRPDRGQQRRSLRHHRVRRRVR